MFLEVLKELIIVMFIENQLDFILDLPPRSWPDLGNEEIIHQTGLMQALQGMLFGEITEGFKRLLRANELSFLMEQSCLKWPTSGVKLCDDGSGWMPTIEACMAAKAGARGGGGASPW